MSDMPNNQCALKDAVNVATAAGVSEPTEIVAMAQAFYAFLLTPSGPAMAQEPAPLSADQLGAVPLENGQPVDTAPVVDAPADEPVAEPEVAVVGEDNATAPE